MGKKQHSKDRMFITKTEWATEWGGAKSKENRTPFKRLPFYCCALTFTPFELPVCTKDGSVFDLMNIIPYIRKYGKHPVTGVSLKQEDLINLTFHKNSEGEYNCPVLNKVFTEYTHIVAVKTTGNVFCYEAIKELNIKTKNWKELLTDEPFTKEDIITVQNPNALDSKVTLDFDHVKNSLKVDDEELRKLSSDPTYNINVAGDIKQMLAELGTNKAKQTALLGGGGSKAQNERAVALAAILAARSRIKEDSKSDANGESKSQSAFSIVDAASASVHGRSAAAAKAASSDKTAARIAMHMAGERAPVNAKMVKSRFTTGAASRSFTSTNYDPVTKNEFEYVKVEKNPKKKGYVQLHTTHGDLNIELHCDITPRTCENFITLCERGYYNGVVFHRNIRNFMIQGGDPTGTGRGGESIWGKPFNDELNSKLLHSGRGVVSMANSGPHTNGSQFFILYKSANHLNFKHTVFGGVVGGLTTLSSMEKVPVDDNDKPLEEIKIISITVFVNPYLEPDEEEEEENNNGEKAAEDEDNDKIGSWYSNPGTGTEESGAVGGGGVGKYLKTRNSQTESAAVDTNITAISVTKKRKTAPGEFKEFSAW
ncbi:PLANT U-BOX 49, plant U-box 49 [Hibiscus trionum]|uniref:PLANT U-BOX 49, plant U-box 49 n=1 Tax=Hibiscus trionum TaxID=183268 RepID=A0A9W7MSX5_HIBTR|nr:PLANT U-BOX 49, plant U-box 49 [Hibiscus trionum]